MEQARREDVEEERIRLALNAAGVVVEEPGAMARMASVMRELKQEVISPRSRRTYLGPQISFILWMRREARDLCDLEWGTRDGVCDKHSIGEELLCCWEPGNPRPLHCSPQTML